MYGIERVGLDAQVASGEPCVYIALHLLHFACFAPTHRATLLNLEVLDLFYIIFYCIA
jgi:hypothetical protein